MHLIGSRKPPQSVPLTDTEAVQMQNNIYSTLATALNRLDDRKHKNYVIRILQMTMTPNVQELETSMLVDLLFSAIDNCWDGWQLLEYQNLLVFGFWLMDSDVRTRPPEDCATPGEALRLQVKKV